LASTYAQRLPTWQLHLSLKSVQAAERISMALEAAMNLARERIRQERQNRYQTGSEFGGVV